MVVSVPSASWGGVMTSVGGGTILAVHPPATVPNDPSGVAHLARRIVMAVVALMMVMAAVTGPVAVASAQGSGDPPGTGEPEPTVPPDPEPTVPPDPEPTVPPETTTTTTFVPPTTVAPAPTTTFAPAPTTTFAPVPSTSPPTSPSTSTSTSTSTTEPTDSSVVADDRTVIDPAPGVVAPTGDGDAVVDADDGPGWWTAGTRLRLAVAGLGGLAMVVSVLTLLYWRHTKPDLTMGARDEPSGDGD